MSPFAVVVFVFAFVLSGIPISGVGAQGRPDDPWHQWALRPDGRVTAPDGVVFESQKAFVDAGRRCNTWHADDLEIEEIEKEVKNHRAATRGGAGSGEAESLKVNPSSITIPVHFHVVYKSDGTGNVPEAWLDNQINAMNEHYAGLDGPVYRTAAANMSFRFTKASVTRTQSDQWYAAGPGSSAETAM